MKGAVPPSSRKDRWYPPGRLYDIVLGGVLRGVRRRVASAVEGADLFPWLDICCGTGIQFRGLDGGPGLLPAVGLDMSRGMVRYAAARAPEGTFICGDAAQLPFKAKSFRAVSVSFGLHDKEPAVRSRMMDEAVRVMAPGGRLIAVDFEKPWSVKSRAGALATWAIERTAGGRHYANGREFVRRGGLNAFLRENGCVEVSRRNIAAGSIAVVVCEVRP